MQHSRLLSYALYVYRCRQYDDVMHLHVCVRILNEPDLQNDLNGLSFANVSVIPPFDSFFDEDVQSLLGVHTLFHYLAPLNDDLHKSYVNNDSTFEQCFVHVVKIRREGLCGFLLGPYYFKCHYFLGRHFLARYLKARCCIDYNLPRKEALTEFATQKPNLPFEFVIHRYFLRKHSFIKQLLIAK